MGNSSSTAGPYYVGEAKVQCAPSPLVVGNSSSTAGPYYVGEAKVQWAPSPLVATVDDVTVDLMGRALTETWGARAQSSTRTWRDIGVTTPVDESVRALKTKAFDLGAHNVVHIKCTNIWKQKTSAHTPYRRCDAKAVIWTPKAAGPVTWTDDAGVAHQVMMNATEPFDLQLRRWALTNLRKTDANISDHA
jgi:hypothetical protein